MKIARIEITGNPIGKGRPKFARRGNFVSTYTPKKTLNYENLIKQCYAEQVVNSEVYENAIDVYVKALFEIPKSTSKKDREKMLDDRIPHTKKPDADNIAKCLDALNGIAWKDDSQIVFLQCQKFYSEMPMLIIEIHTHTPIAECV